MKHLALFLDGTWADPAANTNVSTLHRLTAEVDAEGNEQRARYDAGVGTTWGERLRGGMFGFGLMQNVTEAYTWLVENYSDGDQIHLFGYSRGAFTARSVAGVIARCGLAREPDPATIDRLIARYRSPQAVTPIVRLGWMSTEERSGLPEEDRWVFDHSRRVDVHFIGVWDTVGSLGVPFPVLRRLPLIGKYAQQFHNTNPSTLYKNMFHALAINENRGPFSATLWTEFSTDGSPEGLVKKDQTIEQRWFIGSHGNVGGGGADNPLATVPCAWMQQRAIACGLTFTNEIVPDPRAATAPIGDSYRGFMKGLYRRFRPRHWREIDRPARATTSMTGFSHTLNETIDESVFERWRTDPRYRPSNLADWFTRTGTTP
ncbi:MAG: DUF2235 domain-containing protein [Thermoleophilia bacterium]|nr:DUF2235 domain-containing protein [Thermoleophilia bacterium]